MIKSHRRLALLIFFLSGLGCGSVLAAGVPDNVYSKYNSFLWDGKSTKPWFEWWYFKVNVPNSERSFLFTYGVVNPWDTGNSTKVAKAFVSFAAFPENELVEGVYPVQSFSASREKPQFAIGQNVASDLGLRGNLLTHDGAEVSWDLQMQKIWSFNAMGWGMFHPNITDIFWFPAQASAQMSGVITYRGDQIVLQNASAYQDRNWGRRFPLWWTWLVSNHFHNSPGTVLAAGGGKPHLLGRYAILSGLEVGMTHQGREYIFRLNDGAKIRFQINFGTWEVQATNWHNQKILISAFAPPEKFLDLPFQTPEGPVFHDLEALRGHMRVQLFTRKTIFSKWRKNADLESDEAGIEYGSAGQGVSDIFGQLQVLQQ